MDKFKIFMAAGIILVCLLSLYWYWGERKAAEAWLIPGAPENHMTIEYEIAVSPNVGEYLTHAHVIVPLPVVDNQVPKLAKVENEVFGRGNFTFSWRFVNDPYPGVEIFADGLDYDNSWDHFWLDFYYHVPIENVYRMTLPIRPSENTTVVYAEWDGGPKGWFTVRMSLLGPISDATNSDLRARNVFYHWCAYGWLEGRRPGWYLIGLPTENVLFAPYLGPTFPENLLLT